MLDQSKKINVSFEFFPPKNDEAVMSLWSNIKRLEPLNPCFISVTYGARGTTRDNTHSLVKEIKERMVAIYGDFVLYRPPVQNNTIILWVAPAVLLGVGLIIFGITIFRRRKALPITAVLVIIERLCSKNSAVRLC